MFIFKLGRHIGVYHWRVRACVRVHARVCVCVCVCEYTHTVSEVVVMMYATRAGIWTGRNK